MGDCNVFGVSIGDAVKIDVEEKLIIEADAILVIMRDYAKAYLEQNRATLEHPSNRVALELLKLDIIRTETVIGELRKCLFGLSDLEENHA